MLNHVTSRVLPFNKWRPWVVLNIFLDGIIPCHVRCFLSACRQYVVIAGYAAITVTVKLKKSLSRWMFWKALKSNMDEIALWGFEISMCIFADLGFNRKPLFYIYDVVTWQHVKYECPTMIGRRDIDFRNLKFNLLWRCMQLSVGGSTFQYFEKWPKSLAKHTPIAGFMGPHVGPMNIAIWAVLPKNPLRSLRFLYCYVVVEKRPILPILVVGQQTSATPV